MIIKTNLNIQASKKTNANIVKHIELKEQCDWVKYIVPEKYYQQFANESSYKYISEFRDEINKIKKEIHIDTKIKEIYKSYDSNNITHAGLVYYLNYCWAKEIGVSLRPDIFWYTIISEIAREIIDNADKFKHLFSNNSDKVSIVTKTSKDYEINISMVDKLLEKNILNQDFKKTITEIHFNSQPENFDIALKISFAYMASPYFNYLTTRCGIPHVEILGNLEEYQLLYKKINELKIFLPQLSTYLDECSIIINDIMYWCFDKNFAKPKMEQYTGSEMFFSEIFYINKHCGSGHIYDTYGWFKKLYIKKHGSLSSYPSHINYIPYQFIDENKYFYKAIGLCYSELDIENNLLRPKYGYTIHQVLDKNLFEILKN